MKRPVEIQIFCGGYHSVAWYFALSDHWKCSRCGAVVSVTW